MLDVRIAIKGYLAGRWLLHMTCKFLHIYCSSLGKLRCLAVNVGDHQIEAAHQRQGVRQQHSRAGFLEQAEVGE